MKVYHSIFAVMTVTTGCAADDLGAIESESHSHKIQNNKKQDNELGASTTFSTAGFVDLRNEFFEDFGTNGRDCGHCHKAAEGWTINPDGVQEAFDDTDGRDPIFRTNDGSNSPDADVSTKKKRKKAYSMLLNRGVIRVGLPIPGNAEFTLDHVDDPYGFAHAGELSLFRRPLPSANLAFIPQVMWDGRVSFGGGLPGNGVSLHLNQDLSDQSNGATLGHAAALNPLSQADRDSIVLFETGLFNAQIVSDRVGHLTAHGADGGAETLVDQPRVIGRWNLFDSWATSYDSDRRAVFRGQELFNNRLRQNGVPNPDPNANPVGTCRGCHSVQNVGANVGGIFFNVNASDAAISEPDQPLYTFTASALLQNGQPNPAAGTVIVTTDPGRALITGKWADMGKFKVPSLRALGARAPYFHGGSAKNLKEVVNHYRSNLDPNPFVFTDAEARDLVRFLEAL